jgi:hypothetical protein
MSGGPAPLRFVGLVVLGWMGVRVAILVPDWAPDVPAADVIRAGTAAAPKQAQPPLMYTPRPVLLVSAPTQAERGSYAARAALGRASRSTAGYWKAHERLLHPWRALPQ